jgi:hypothetical protein
MARECGGDPSNSPKEGSRGEQRGALGTIGPIKDLAPVSNKPIRDDREQEDSRALETIVLEAREPTKFPCLGGLAKSCARKMPRTGGTTSFSASK